MSSRGIPNFGVDLDSLPSQFEGCVEGRTLILDGDGPCYRAAATTKKLPTAIRRLQQDILTQMFLTKAQFCTVHFTHRSSVKNGRGNVIATKPYQGNRKGKSKPALLEPLRDAMASRENWLPEFTVQMHTKLEADDGMIIEAHQLKESGVIWSEDKDLRLTPYLYYDRSSGQIEGPEPVGWLAEKYTEQAGNLKIIGRSQKFFWCQMLMGDSADNVQGIQRLDGKLCGPAGAYAALKDVHTLGDIGNLVVDAYRKIDQNVLAEAYLLWLLRHPHENVLHYLLSDELGLSSENRTFVHDCSTRVWHKQHPDYKEPE